MDIVRTLVWSISLTIEELMKQGPDLPLRDDQWEEGKLVVQDDIEKGAVDVKAAVVVNEAQLPELI
jgi:hypothetical protein